MFFSGARTKYMPNINKPGRIQNSHNNKPEPTYKEKFTNYKNPAIEV